MTAQTSEPAMTPLQAGSYDLPSDWPDEVKAVMDLLCRRPFMKDERRSHESIRKRFHTKVRVALPDGVAVASGGGTR